MNIKKLRKIDWLILICALMLCGVGLIALFSASYDSDLDEFKKQAIWMGISIGIMIIVMFIDYKILIKLSPILYGISIIALIAVLFTKPINGARSWFNIKGSPKKCENLNLRAPRAPNRTKVPSCADFTGRMAELYAPFWGASCLLSRPASARKG